MFGRLKDWRRVATHYNRCSTVLLAAVAFAANVLFWLRPMSPEPSSTPIGERILTKCAFAGQIAQKSMIAVIHYLARHRLRQQNMLQIDGS